MRRATAELLACLMVAVSAFGLVGPGPALATGSSGGVPASTTSPTPSLTPSLTAEITDMFNVPYGEWWDYRTAIYGDLPVGSTCFNKTSITDGVCSLPGVPQSALTNETYPYNNMYPWYADRKDIIVNAPYRLHFNGVDQPGSTLANPVILPVFNATQAAGSSLRVKWDMQYIDKLRQDTLNANCGAGVSTDGYIIESFINVTMDLQESKRVFGVGGTTPADAAAWWKTNVDPACFAEGALETKWAAFMQQQGGSSHVMGPYDVYNSFEWFYQPFMTAFTASVDPATGMTTVKIDHVSWATEVLLARWFYWGPNTNGGYLTWAANDPNFWHLGWMPWYLAWFEDFHFDTNIGALAQNLTLNTVMQYHLQAYANAGRDGIFHTATVQSTDDRAEWLWQPYLTDYVYGGTSSGFHTVSELDAYIGLTYLHANPGSIYYGTQYKYDFVPASWNLGPADTVTIRLPQKPVKFISPYSPLNSVTADLVRFDSKMGFNVSTPGLPAGSTVTDANQDSINDTITLVGPIIWGAPSKPLWGYPALEFGAQVPFFPGKADLVGRAAWPDHHHFDMSKFGNFQTFNGLVANLGTNPVDVAVVFTVRDSNGIVVGTVQTSTVTLQPGLSTVLTAQFKVKAGKYSVAALAFFDSTGDHILDAYGMKMKSFSYDVVP